MSDSIGPTGLVYAVEFSHRGGKDLVNMAKKRTNVIHINEDARHPAKYRMLVGMDAWLMLSSSDVAQPEQVHEELLAAIKDVEEGLLRLKRSRLLKQIDDIIPNQGSESQETEAAIEPLDEDDVELEPLEPEEFSVGSKCKQDCKHRYCIMDAL